jgi:L-rhamnose mutarotase
MPQNAPERRHRESAQPVNTAWQARMAELLDVVHDYSVGGVAAALPGVWAL